MHSPDTVCEVVHIIMLFILMTVLRLFGMKVASFIPGGGHGRVGHGDAYPILVKQNNSKKRAGI